MNRFIVFFVCFFSMTLCSSSNDIIRRTLESHDRVFAAINKRMGKQSEHDNQSKTPTSSAIDKETETRIEAVKKWATAVEQDIFDAVRSQVADFLSRPVSMGSLQDAERSIVNESCVQLQALQKIVQKAQSSIAKGAKQDLEKLLSLPTPEIEKIANGERIRLANMKQADREIAQEWLRMLRDPNVSMADKQQAFVFFKIKQHKTAKELFEK